MLSSLDSVPPKHFLKVRGRLCSNENGLEKRYIIAAVVKPNIIISVQFVHFQAQILSSWQLNLVSIEYSFGEISIVQSDPAAARVRAPLHHDAFCPFSVWSSDVYYSYGIDFFIINSWQKNIIHLKRLLIMAKMPYRTGNMQNASLCTIYTK